MSKFSLRPIFPHPVSDAPNVAFTWSQDCDSEAATSTTEKKEESPLPSLTLRLNLYLLDTAFFNRRAEVYGEELAQHITIRVDNNENNNNNSNNSNNEKKTMFPSSTLEVFYENSKERDECDRRRNIISDWRLYSVIEQDSVKLESCKLDGVVYYGNERKEKVTVLHFVMKKDANVHTPSSSSSNLPRRRLHQNRLLFEPMRISDNNKTAWPYFREEKITSKSDQDELFLPTFEKIEKELLAAEVDLLPPSSSSSSSSNNSNSKTEESNYLSSAEAIQRTENVKFEFKKFQDIVKKLEAVIELTERQIKGMSPEIEYLQKSIDTVVEKEKKLKEEEEKEEEKEEELEKSKQKLLKEMEELLQVRRKSKLINAAHKFMLDCIETKHKMRSDASNNNITKTLKGKLQEIAIEFRVQEISSILQCPRKFPYLVSRFGADADVDDDNHNNNNNNSNFEKRVREFLQADCDLLRFSYMTAENSRRKKVDEFENEVKEKLKSFCQQEKKSTETTSDATSYLDAILFDNKVLIDEGAEKSATKEERQEEDEEETIRLAVLKIECLATCFHHTPSCICLSYMLVNQARRLSSSSKTTAAASASSSSSAEGDAQLAAAKARAVEEELLTHSFHFLFQAATKFRQYNVNLFSSSSSKQQGQEQKEEKEEKEEKEQQKEEEEETFDPIASASVAQLVINNHSPFNSNFAFAIFLLQESAKQGNTSALVFLAKLHHEGQCTHQFPPFVPERIRKNSRKELANKLVAAALDRGAVRAYAQYCTHALESGSLNEAEFGGDGSDEVVSELYFLETKKHSLYNVFFPLATARERRKMELNFRKQSPQQAKLTALSTTTTTSSSSSSSPSNNNNNNAAASSSASPSSAPVIRETFFGQTGIKVSAGSPVPGVGSGLIVSFQGKVLESFTMSGTGGKICSLDFATTKSARQQQEEEEQQEKENEKEKKEQKEDEEEEKKKEAEEKEDQEEVYLAVVATDQSHNTKTFPIRTSRKSNNAITNKTEEEKLKLAIVKQTIKNIEKETQREVNLERKKLETQKKHVRSKFAEKKFASVIGGGVVGAFTAASLVAWLWKR